MASLLSPTTMAFLKSAQQSAQHDNWQGGLLGAVTGFGQGQLQRLCGCAPINEPHSDH